MLGQIFRSTLGQKVEAMLENLGQKESTVLIEAESNLSPKEQAAGVTIYKSFSLLQLSGAL